MNKYELACQVAKDTGKSHKEVIPIVNSLFSILSRTILDGEKISVTELGTFSLKVRKQRQGYDTFRHVGMIIPEGMSLKFTISPSLQKKIREKYKHEIVPEKVMMEM